MISQPAHPDHLSTKTKFKSLSHGYFTLVLNPVYFVHSSSNINFSQGDAYFLTRFNFCKIQFLLLVVWENYRYLQLFLQTLVSRAI